jgi:hypothetical protein
VLGRPRHARRDHEAVVLGALAVGALDLGIGDGRLDDPGCERRPQIVGI